jgi:hypothetical protein
MKYHQTFSQMSLSQGHHVLLQIKDVQDLVEFKQRMECTDAVLVRRLVSPTTEKIRRYLQLSYFHDLYLLQQNESGGICS